MTQQREREREKASKRVNMQRPGDTIDGESKMIERHNREQNKVVQNQRDKEERNGRARPSSSQSIIGTERERRKDE